MTSGELLKKNLGLEDFKYVRITRAVLSAYSVYLVFFDSYRKQMPVTIHRMVKFPYVAMFFSGTDLEKGINKRPQLTPPMDIEQFNGNLRGTYVIPVNLAGDRFIDRKQFSKVIESKGKELHHVMSMNRVKDDDGKLIEFVTLSDLNRTDIVSDRTMFFRQRRNRLMGAENTLVKLIDTVIDEGDKSVTFQFLTEVTEDEETYGPEYDYQEVNPETLALRRNASKVYEVSIKVLDFLDWLDTEPDRKDITRSDIKEILETANIQVFSTSPSFHFQGFNFWLSQLDGSIHPTTIEPKRWNNIHGDGEAFLDKHTYGLFRSIKFFEQQMASQLTKKLKSRGLI